MSVHVMKVPETLDGTWECPDCSYQNELFLVIEDELPEYVHCSVCGHQSTHICWYKEE